MSSSPPSANGDSQVSSSTLWSARLLGGLLVGWTFLACLFPLSDFDIWWHLRAGQLILERGVVPTLDWFTYTNSDRPWIDLHWGFQVLAAWIYGRFGADGLVAAKAAAIATAAGIAWSAAGRATPSWVRVLLWIPGLMAIYGRGYERPEVLSLIFLAAWLWVTVDLDRRMRWTPLLVLVQVLWVNCHSLFVLGLVVGGAALGDQALRGWMQRRGGLERAGLAPLTHGRSVWFGVALAVLCVAAGLLNPYGLQGLLFPEVVYRKFTVEQAFYAARIGEFQRPIEFLRAYGLASPTLAAELAVWGLTAASFLLLAIVRRRWHPGRVVLFVAFSHLAWEAARNTNLFCLASTTLMLANVSDLGRWGERPAAAPWHRGLNVLAGVLLLLGMGAVTTGIWGWWLGGSKTFGLGERPAWFAHEAARAAGREGFPRRVLAAHFGQAAVYSFHAGPEGRVFMDGRLEVCSQQTFEEWETIVAQLAVGDRRWEAQHLADYGELPVVLLDRRECLPQIEALRRTPGWVEVYSDQTASVFVDEPTARTVR
ncbi:MAG: hypothetical protein U0939_11495 [Pirellulales bacterium]